MNQDNNYRKRFLRDGVLDEMIEFMRLWDRELNRNTTIQAHSLAPLIHLFESNKLILKRLERKIELLKQSNNSMLEDCIIWAMLVQSGLRNSYEGLLDEKSNFKLK